MFTLFLEFLGYNEGTYEDLKHYVGSGENPNKQDFLLLLNCFFVFFFLNDKEYGFGDI